MGWDSKWEEFYKKSRGNEYPETAVVRFIARYFYKSNNRNEIKILDLGCGTGANLWYLSREGFSASGIDGSKTAIERTGEKLDREGINANLLTGDFQNLPYDPDFFDAVLDITSIQHNDDASIRKIVAEVHRVMKPDGKYFGMMINSDENLTVNDFI
jgi:ubiquinone/menaquinone biosynthesis C-methylase UbiE